MVDVVARGEQRESLMLLRKKKKWCLRCIRGLESVKWCDYEGQFDSGNSIQGDMTKVSSLKGDWELFKISQW